jgi:hypothetical protein
MTDSARDNDGWTVRTTDGTDLPPEIARVVESWLRRTDGAVVEALVLAAEEFLILSAAASFGLSRGRVALPRSADDKPSQRSEPNG